jgi:hypothetical protein
MQSAADIFTAAIKELLVAGRLHLYAARLVETHHGAQGCAGGNWPAKLAATKSRIRRGDSRASFYAAKSGQTA